MPRPSSWRGRLPLAQTVDTLKKIKDTGAVTMGVREASGAMSYTLGAGDYTGFHVDVCKRVVADIQKQLGLAKLEVRYQSVTAQNRIPLVQNGTVDLDAAPRPTTPPARKTWPSRPRST